VGQEPRPPERAGRPAWFGLLQPAGSTGPLLDVGPVPDHRLLEFGDGFGEVGEAFPPRVDHLVAGVAEALGDLARADEVAGVHEAGHGENLTRRE